MSSMENKRSGKSKSKVMSGRAQKRFGKTRKGSRRKTSGARSLDGSFAPPKVRATLPWALQVTAAASATYADITIRGNGLFDPGTGSSSTQPVGFDQYATWYAFYRVRRSTIKLTLALASTSATPTAAALACTFVLYPSNTSSPAATLAEAMAQPGAKIIEVSGEAPKKMSMSASNSLILGNKGYGFDATGANTSADPSNSWFWHVGAAGGNYTSVVSKMDIRVDYDTDFFDRYAVPLSVYLSMAKETNTRCAEERKRRADSVYVSPFKETKEAKSDGISLTAQPQLTPSVRKYVMVDVEDPMPKVPSRK